MIRARPPIVVLGLAALVAGSLWWLRVANTGEATAGVEISDPIEEALSGIDFVPTRALLDDAFGPMAPASLEVIARNTNQTFDVGLRIRAYYGLSLYPLSSLSPLLEAVDQHGSNLIVSGPDLVLAKAAIGALATITPNVQPAQQALVIAQLGDVLNHPVLDLRAAAAAALGTTGLATAKPALTQRLQIESASQVIEAINLSLAQLRDNIAVAN